MEEAKKTIARFMTSGEQASIVKSASEQALNVEAVAGNVESGAAALLALGKVTEALFTPSLFGARQVVWLRHANFLYDSKSGRQTEVKAALGRLAERIQQGLPQGQMLVVTAVKVDRRCLFYKVCKEHGVVVELNVSSKPHEAIQEMEKWTAERSRQLGLHMPPEVAALFVERVGYDARQLASELEKLAVYVRAPATVRRSDVEAITAVSSEIPAWDLADAVGQRDLNRALAILGRLLFQGESAIGLAIGVQKRLEELILYREACDRRWFRGAGREMSGGWAALSERAEKMLAEGWERDPRQAHPYRQKLLAAQAQRFSAIALQKCRQEALAAHERLVSQRTSEPVVLETMLVKMLS